MFEKPNEKPKELSTQIKMMLGMFGLNPKEIEVYISDFDALKIRLENSEKRIKNIETMEKEICKKLGINLTAPAQAEIKNPPLIPSL